MLMLYLLLVVALYAFVRLVQIPLASCCSRRWRWSSRSNCKRHYPRSTQCSTSSTHCHLFTGQRSVAIRSLFSIARGRIRPANVLVSSLASTTLQPHCS